MCTMITAVLDAAAKSPADHRIHKITFENLNSMQHHAEPTHTHMNYVCPSISIPAVHLAVVSQQSNVLLSPYASSAMQ